jgi:hypothetical protein
MSDNGQIILTGACIDRGRFRISRRIVRIDKLLGVTGIVLEAGEFFFRYVIDRSHELYGHPRIRYTFD